MGQEGSRAADGGSAYEAHVPVDVRSHKLFPPPVRPSAIGRHAIIERLVERVVLLQGPAGSGKSTTLRQLLGASERAGATVAWLTLDDADNDPRRFEAHLWAIHRQLTAGRGAVGTSPRDGLLDAFARIEHPVAMFVDEVQVLHSASILQLLRSLLANLPPWVRVFLGSRTLPEIGMATLLVKGVATVLRADDLRFTEAEAIEFFASEPRIGPEEVRIIYRRTEGWPAGLQLFRLALASPAVRLSLDDIASRSPRELAEYLTDNVVSLQTPAVRDFLLRTSLLRRLSGPLCDAVVGRTDAQDVLRHLERSGLFVTALDATEGWFKYHGLFASFLAESLRRTSPDAVREVHLRAAAWHLANRSHEEAVYHAAEAGDLALAATALNVWASQLIARGELMTVERWYDVLPFAEVTARIDLSIKAAWALVFLRRRNKLPALLAHLEGHAGTGDVRATTSPGVVLAMASLFEDDMPGAAALATKCDIDDLSNVDFAAFELGAAANLVAFAHVSAGRFEATHAALTLARAHNRRASATFSGGYTTAVAGFQHMLEGAAGDALQRFDAGGAGAYAHHDKSIALAARAAAHLWALYETNDLAQVEQLGARFREEIATSAVPDFIAVAHLVLARTHDLRGRRVPAQETLEALEKVGHDGGWPRLVHVADCERARRALFEGDPHRAAAILQRLGPTATTAVPRGWLTPSDAIEGVALGRIRLAIALGDHAAAARSIAAELGAAPERTYYRVKLWSLEAVLHARKGQTNAAHRSLRRALAISQDGGLVRAILDEGPPIVALLADEHRSLVGDAAVPARRDHVKRLLEVAGVASPALESPPPASREPLSEREKEILRFLCAGSSNKEMAGRLFVSENTIKFHLKNIYGKLAVCSRSQAIHAARHHLES